MWLVIQNFLLNGCIFKMLVTGCELEKIAILDWLSLLAIIDDIVSCIMLILRLLWRLRRKELFKCGIFYFFILFFLFNICISIFIGGRYTKRCCELPTLVRWVWRWEMSSVIKLSKFLLVILRWTCNVRFLVIFTHLCWLVSFWCVFTAFILLLSTIHLNI